MTRYNFQAIMQRLRNDHSVLLLSITVHSGACTAYPMRTWVHSVNWVSWTESFECHLMEYPFPPGDRVRRRHAAVCLLVVSSAKKCLRLFQQPLVTDRSATLSVGHSQLIGALLPSAVFLGLWIQYSSSLKMQAHFGSFHKKSCLLSWWWLLFVDN